MKDEHVWIVVPKYYKGLTGCGWICMDCGIMAETAHRRKNCVGKVKIKSRGTKRLGVDNG